MIYIIYHYFAHCRIDRTFKWYALSFSLKIINSEPYQYNLCRRSKFMSGKSSQFVLLMIDLLSPCKWCWNSSV